jgi:DNA-binding transcriptional ArsR family regulator
MIAAVQAEYKAHARIAKALSHPTRPFIIDVLSRSELCVFELTEMIGVEMPTVSRHLDVLGNAGVLKDEKRRAKLFYRLRLPSVLNLFKRIEAIQKTCRE